MKSNSRIPRNRAGIVTGAVAALLVCLMMAGTATAAPWIWDHDADGIDDRIERIEAEGLAAAYAPDGRLAVAVSDLGGLFTYGVYVGFDHAPTQADLDMLAASGVSTAVMKPYQIIDYVRMELSLAEIQMVAALPGVTRVEAIDVMYPINNNAGKTSGVIDSAFKRFPTVQGNLGLTGEGVVVSILDTGVNDEADPVTGYPGHEAFTGKFIAGGEFFSGDPNLNTGTDDSVNPVDRGEAASSTHGTHVAGTTLGTGGPSAVFGGVAPGALLVDQKVLSDAGAGFGSADGVEWAVLNKDRYGIRVLNLSLGGVNNSDGTDAGSQAINAAFDAGLIPLVAAGNDGETNYVSSPAAADKALTIGSLADQNTLRREDDAISSFSNEGPRLADGDGDFSDEMKPLVAGPGSGIVSADGSLATDGRNYKILSGTSMSTPHVAGVVALLLEAKPDLTPTQVVEILKHTSEHRDAWGKVPATTDPFPQGDPNYHPSGGWGQVDGYAAVKEALRLTGDPASQTQVVYIHGEPADDGSAAIDVTWKSQREIDLVGYDVYRAEDVGGAPGVFTKVNAAAIPGVGRPEIEGLPNRNLYSFRDSGLAFGNIYWYRIDHTSSNPAVGTIQEPPLAVTLGQPQPVARIQYSITHNTFDNDLLVLLGSGPELARPAIVIDGKSAEEADSVTTETGEPTTGNQRYEFTIDLTTLDGVEPFLPPSKQNPWFLSVKEGGFVNRAGRVNSFSITLFDADGNPTETFSTGDPTPAPTIEGQTTAVWIPDDPNVFLPGDSPTVAEVDPEAAAQGTTSLAVEIFGAEFVGGASVSVSGDGVTVDSAEVTSGSRILATLTIATDATPGPRDVTVTNLDGGSGTGADLFTVVRNGGGGGGGGEEPEVHELDDDDPAIEYRTGWHRKKDDGASAGGYHRRMGSRTGTGSTPLARLVFTGYQITYFYAVSAYGGSADVYLDGTLIDTVSYDGPGHQSHPTFGSEVTYDDLGDGEHELLIEHRTGAVYLDGFRIVSGGDGGGDVSSPQSRSVTSSSSGELGEAGIATLVRTVEVGAFDTAVSVLVEGSDHPLTVNLLDPAGLLVATGEALLTGTGTSGLDAAVSAPGTYTVQVIDPLGGGFAVDLSTARTVRVR